jgi:hypothetical protein
MKKKEEAEGKFDILSGLMSSNPTALGSPPTRFHIHLYLRIHWPSPVLYLSPFVSPLDSPRSPLDYIGIIVTASSYLSDTAFSTHCCYLQCGNLFSQTMCVLY